MRYLETVMGIPMSMDVRDPGDHGDVARAAFASLRDADARFSTYRADSEVSRANRGELKAADFSVDLREVIGIGAAAAEWSGGAFRIRNPDGTLDLDGVVKGWAAARAGDILKAAGLHDFCVNAGGDVVVAGAPIAGERWNVGVRSPDDPNRMLAVLAVTDAAVATSGAYERGQHIVDGRQGEPARGMRSVTVVADDLTTADVLATAVFVLGPDGLPWALDRGARGVLAVTSDGELLGAGDLAFAGAGA
ncbi:FAD:protein FMN transferase [Leifsonia poae]|uniref:FAD:protein FMN transferase n=1 Tax=Leifsonia poae TaxID=110933 RepID=UPI003D6722F5